MNVCRTCLSIAVEKDIAQLPNDLEVKETSTEIMLFCLNINVTPELKLTTKLCITCYLKILEFFKFKKLAVNNEKYLRSTKTNNGLSDLKVIQETFLIDNIKNEDTNIYEDNINEHQSDIDFKIEYDFKVENNNHSEDEFLSVVKRIKDENRNEETKEKVGKGNYETSVQKKQKKSGKRKRNRELEKREHMCETCGKSVINLREHLYLHKPMVVRKRYKCKACDKDFVHPSARLKHYKIKHLGIKYRCEFCNKDVVALSSHLKTMHNVGTLPFECVPCGRRFISRSLRDLHTLIHTKDRPHKCDQCDKGYKSKLHLQMHRRQVHDKEKTHVCHYCSKSFFKKYHLQVHMRCHSKEKPYECPECNKRFATTSVLKNHRLVHSDVKSFACELCDMKFSRQGYLKNHMISHTKEKRYSCRYCGLRFGRSDHRLRHERNSHEKQGKL